MRFRDIKEGDLIDITTWDMAGKKPVSKIGLVISDLRTPFKNKRTGGFDLIYRTEAGLRKIFLSKASMRAGMKKINDPKLAEKLLKEYIVACIEGTEDDSDDG